MSSKQDKRKHRGPNTKITPKSREFIETDSSSSSSECQSDSEESLKIPAVLPTQAARSAINTQTLSSTHMHAPLLPCLASVSSLGTFPGKSLRVKDGGTVTANGSSSTNGSISSSSNGTGAGCNSLSISNISSSFGTSVPDPGGISAQCKDLESMSPPPNVGHEVPLSPLREYQECQSLWVKIDLSLLSRVPGQGSGDRSRAVIADRGGSDGRDRLGQRERTGVAERERQKQDDKEWQGVRDRPKIPKGEKMEEENERLADRDGLADRERPVDREDRERFGLGERDRTAGRDREKLCHSLGVLDDPPAQEQSNPRMSGRAERAENGGKHRKQAAGNIVLPTEKHTSKRKHKVKSFNISICHFSPKSYLLKPDLH